MFLLQNLIQRIPLIRLLFATTVVADINEEVVFHNIKNTSVGKKHSFNATFVHIKQNKNVI